MKIWKSLSTTVGRSPSLGALNLFDWVVGAVAGRWTRCKAYSRSCRVVRKCGYTLGVWDCKSACLVLLLLLLVSLQLLDSARTFG